MATQCPPEIIRKILLSLHRVDLLNSRLISPSWNSGSVSILNNSGYTLDLNEINLEQYVEFSQQKQSSSKIQPLFIMPFSLTLTFGKNPSEQSTTTKFKKILNNVEALVKLFGPKCVSGVKFKIYADVHELVPLALELLAKVNKGLNNWNNWLHFRIYATFDNEENFFKNCTDLILPKVEYLYMYADDMNAQAAFWPQLAEKCLNVVDVQILSYSIRTSDENWPLSSSSFTEIRRLATTGLLQLSTVSNKICNSPWLSNLTWFKIGVPGYFDNNPLYFNDMRNLLDHLSNTLIGLALQFCGVPIIPTQPFFIPGNLQFKRLNTLRIHFEDDSKVKCPPLLIESSRFPALEFVTLPYCMEVKIPNENEAADDFLFPKVQSLSLFVNEHLELTPKEPYKDHMEKLQTIFKHVSMVSIVNCTGDCYDTCDSCHCGGRRVKYVLEGIIQSAGAIKITDFTLDYCHENYLGMILSQIHDPLRIVIENLQRNYLLEDALKKTLQKFTGSVDFFVIDQKNHNKSVVIQQRTQQLKMRNLKKLRLVLNSFKRYTCNSCRLPSRDDSSSTKNSMDTPMELYVKTMVKNFPYLEEIHVSSFLFGRNTKVRTEILQQIGKECPNIVIDVI